VGANQTISLRAEHGPVLAELSGRPSAHEALAELDLRSVKVRTRALVTTMFARLFVSDVFIHGLGGAKYDEITDEIIRRFWRIEPPRFIVLSGSLRLPFRCTRREVIELDKLRRTVRDLRWNPDRHLASGKQEPAKPLVEEKARWIAFKAENPVQRRDRFQQLRRLNSLIQPFVAEELTSARDSLSLCDRQVQLELVLCDRDFAFCLFPESKLRPFCQLRPTVPVAWSPPPDDHSLVAREARRLYLSFHRMGRRHER
jgi:hypothetical protein